MNAYAFVRIVYVEDVTWWSEDMNFIFEWWKQYAKNDSSEGEHNP